MILTKTTSSLSQTFKLIGLVLLAAIGMGMFLGSAAQAAPVSVDNSDVFWSPYGWVADGSTYKQSPTTGAHINIAFSGDTLALNVDTSFVVNPASLRVSAFIDGSSTPIHRTLADASANQITFSNSLDSGNHYAHIVIMRNTDNSGKWTVTGDTPRSTLRINSIEISDSGSVLPLNGTPLVEKDMTILFYGDSITEGNGINGVDNYFATGATVGRLLNSNYGIKGYASSTWHFNILSGVTDFYYPAGADYPKAAWKNYYQNQSLLNDVNNPSSGYKDGIPDAIYNNLGINDASLYANPTWGGEPARLAYRDKILGWLPEARQALGGRSAIFMVVPYSYNCTEDINPSLNEETMALYKATYIDAYNTYINSSGDTRTFLVDLGSEGCRIAYEDGDGLHPSAPGAINIAEMIVTQTQSQIILEGDVAMTAQANGQIVSDDLTLDNPPTLQGTAPAGTVVTLSLTQNGGTTTCETEANELGEWACTFSQTLAGGNYTLSIAGETSWNETISFGTFSIQLAAIGQPASNDGQPEANNALANSGMDIAPLLGTVILIITITLISRRVHPVFRQFR